MHLFLLLIFSAFTLSLSSNTSTLDEWRKMHNVQILEGHVAGLQAEQLKNFLKEHSEIRSVMEIGLNGGHSAEIFFDHCPNLEHFVSFDICYWPYVEKVVDFFTQKFGTVFSFVRGDSAQSVPAFARHFPSMKFDLIFIDGNHSFEGCMADIVNCKALADKNTLLLIDDYTYSETVRGAITQCARRKVIKIDQVHHEEHGWVEAHYTFK